MINPVVCAARACTLFGISSSDANSDTFTYLWNFGDATATSTAVSPAHTYAVDGTYTVTLTTTDAWGDAATATRVVTIAKPVTNVPPVGVIGVPVCAARACTFSGVGSADANGDAITYSWNWGDAHGGRHGREPARAHVRRRWDLHGDPHDHRRVG